jgi:hypothetical protein
LPFGASIPLKFRLKWRRDEVHTLRYSLTSYCEHWEYADDRHAPSFDINAAERFANLALACVHREYSNKISHNLNSDVDVAPPRKLTVKILNLL